MNYGNKFNFFIIFILLIFLIGCSTKNFYIELYNDFSIKKSDEKIKLYKNDLVFDINNLDYKIISFNYNEDVVCLKLDNESYYIIYFIDSNIYGPFNEENYLLALKTLNIDILDLENIMEVEGRIYE